MGGDKLAWAKETNMKGLKVFEAMLPQSKGQYCVGDSVTFADIVLIPQLYNAERFGITLKDEFPLIHEIHERLQKLPEFIKAHANNQPDATP